MNAERPTPATTTTQNTDFRILDDRGAFLLRKAVESVGEMMGVSRITIYNYLNAIQADDD